MAQQQVLERHGFHMLSKVCSILLDLNKSLRQLLSELVYQVGMGSSVKVEWSCCSAILKCLWSPLCSVIR